MKNVKEKLMRTIGNAKLGAKRNAPELLLAGALVTGTATVYAASKSAVKATHLNGLNKAEIENINAMVEKMQITNSQEKEMLKKVHLKHALDLVKNYAIPVGLYLTTVMLIFSSYKIQKNRQIALSGALVAATTAYNKLVKKLKVGAAGGLTAQEVLDGVEVKRDIDPETGGITETKVQGEPVDTSIYKFRFDRYSTEWEQNKFQNSTTLQCTENWMNDKLRLDGHVFLNEVLERLGLPKTPAGQIVGWLYEGDGDGFIDFGVTDCCKLEGPEYDDNAFNLNFNCDGDILTKFDGSKMPY